MSAEWGAKNKMLVCSKLGTRILEYKIVLFQEGMALVLDLKEGVLERQQTLARLSNLTKFVF